MAISWIREPIGFVDDIPVFSSSDRYIDNYMRIARDHLAAVKPGASNPWIPDALWCELTTSTVNLIDKHSRHGQRILDAGVGLGHVLEACGSLERHGLDISFEYLREARERGIEVIFSKIEEMPYEDGSFDLVVCCDVLEHVFDLNRCCEQLLRVLKPGGFLIVRVPNEENLDVYLESSSPYEFIHMRRFDLASLRLLFEKAFSCEFVEASTVGHQLQGPPRMRLRLLSSASSAVVEAASIMDTDGPLALLRKATAVSEEELNNWIYALKKEHPHHFEQIAEQLIIPIEANVVFRKHFWPVMNIISGSEPTLAGPTTGEIDRDHLSTEENDSFWSNSNVTNHKQFDTASDSLEYLKWRNDQYFGYLDLMPVDAADNLSVLDYGCGPGHDLVGFGLYSKPKTLIGMDVSEPSLREARLRLALHGIQAQLITIHTKDARLPLEPNSIDLIHCSGVLHHLSRPDLVLSEFRRILRPGGRAQIMVYNEDSIFVHLYVAYKKMIVEGLYQGMDVRTAFGKLTDGPDCPISIAYKPHAFMKFADQVGFKTKYLGAAISAHEMALLPARFDAIMDRRLPAEHRGFLSSLTFSSRGLPLYNGSVAGVDGCFELVRP